MRKLFDCWISNAILIQIQNSIYCAISRRHTHRIAFEKDADGASLGEGVLTHKTKAHPLVRSNG